MSINNKYQPLYIASDNTITTVENISSNLQFCEVNNSINTISVPTIINQNIDEDLNLSAFDGSSINPIIKINNTHQHVNITSNLGIGTQNPQCKLDVNGDIQFKSNNEFNNISDFFPGYYKSINSGTNIGLPLDFKANVGHDSTTPFEDYKKIIYNGMEIKMTGTTIYSKSEINGYYNGPPTGAQSSVIYNGEDVHGFYFQLTGTSHPIFENGSYVSNTSSASDIGHIFIKLLDTAIYKNKFTEISFDIVHTNPNAGGNFYEVRIRNPLDDTTLFKVRFGSWTGHEFVSIENKGMVPTYLGGGIGENHFKVSSNKLAFNGRTDPGQNIFFNIRLVFDDEFRIYFDNEQLVTDMSGGVGSGQEVRRVLDNNFKAYINDDKYNELVFYVENGDAGSDVHIKNIQIKSGFGCFIST